MAEMTNAFGGLINSSGTRKESLNLRIGQQKLLKKIKNVKREKRIGGKAQNTASTSYGAASADLTQAQLEHCELGKADLQG